jgi:hypothetical protein
LLLLLLVLLASPSCARAGSGSPGRDEPPSRVVPGGALVAGAGGCSPLGRDGTASGAAVAAHGFVAYYLIDTGGGSLVTLSVFADRAGAEESTRAAAKLIGELGLVDALPDPPTIMQGEVAIHA